MKLFKNTSANIDADCSVIMYAHAEEMPTQYGTWVEVNPETADSININSLFVQAGVRYYGYL